MPRTIKQGDTWPPLYGSAVDENGLVDLTGAASLEVFLRSTGHLVTGTPVAIWPAIPDPDDPAELRNWMFDFTGEPGCTGNAGVYATELKVTWTTSPLKVTTFPNTGSETLTIEADG